jgi:hypothetical protein
MPPGVQAREVRSVHNYGYDLAKRMMAHARLGQELVFCAHGPFSAKSHRGIETSRYR